MKQILWQHRIQLILLVVALVVVLILSLAKTSYIVTAPGYNNNVDKFIEIDVGYEVTGSFRTTSVIVLNEMTSLQYIIGRYVDTVQIREQPEYYDDIDIGDLRVMGYLSKDDSLARSLVVGFTRAQYEIDYESKVMVYLTYNYLDADTLELGDVIVSINGGEPLVEADLVGCDETAEFSILRDGEPMTFQVTKHQLEGYCAFGLNIRTFTDILSEDLPYTLHDSTTGGSSGGLMQALYVYNQLTPNDITGGRDIAGTGTIDVDGNVGRIGGIEQKIITSALNNIDIFFVPYLSDADSDNYIVAQQVLAGLNTDMVLVPVQTIDDAIEYLEARYGGAFDE